jgi:hypothetical protein
MTLEERFAWMRDKQAQADKVADVAPELFERVFTPTEAAKIWGQSVKATREYFAEVPGVRKIGRASGYSPTDQRYKRQYYTYVIPASVLEREIKKVTIN